MCKMAWLVSEKQPVTFELALRVFTQRDCSKGGHMFRVPLMTVRSMWLFSTTAAASEVVEVLWASS